MLVGVLGCRAARLEPLPSLDHAQVVAHAETLDVRVDGDSVG